MRAFRRSLPALMLTAAVTAASPASATNLSPLAGGPFEASGATYLAGGNGVLFVDDGRPGEVLWLPLTAQGSQGAPVQAVPIGVSVADPEGITTDGTWVYVVGSLSRGTGASLARFRFDPATRTASGVESMDGLEALLRSRVPEIAAAVGAGNAGKKAKKGKKNKAGGINIEGLAWDPKGSRLLLGIRSPVVDGSALVVPLRLRDPSAPLAADNVAVEGPALRVPLDGSGIRSIEYSADAGMFQIIAGHPTGAADFRLVLWDGAAAVREVQKFLPSEKPEGVARATIGGRKATVVVFDTSHFAVLP